MLHQLARYASIAPLIDELGGGDVLDVGSGSEGVAGWIGEGWTVTAVDRSFDYAGAMPGPRPASTRTVIGDVRRLPFADRTFDVVLALDLLEHLEAGDRRQAIDELVRTARRRVIVACPTGETALAADKRLATGLRRRGMEPPDWLIDHERHGFPEVEELREQLDGRGRVRMIGNENVRWHCWLIGFEFRRPGFHFSRIMSAVVAAGLASQRMRGNLSRIALRIVQGPRRPPSYRTIAVLDVPAERNQLADT